MNNVLNVRTQWRLNQLPELIEKLREIVVRQFHKADRALMGRGEFHFRPSWVRHGLSAFVCSRHRQRPLMVT